MEQYFFYASAALFLAGFLYRLGRWLAAPEHLPLTVYPCPGRNRGQWTYLGGELLFFRSLFRQNRPLWLLSWGFHASLALIFLGHLLGIYYTGKHFSLLGLEDATGRAAAHFGGTASGLLLLTSLAGLSLRRFWATPARLTTQPKNLLELALLTGIALSGMLLRFVLTDRELGQIRSYLVALFTFQPVAMPDIPLFSLHFALSSLLLLILPYSSLLHGLGATFSFRLLTALPAHALSRNRQHRLSLSLYTHFRDSQNKGR